jgi:predicted nucleotidyltransferase
MRLAELRKRLEELQELTAFPTLTVFGAGSYARLEASQYSDIDMFFLIGGRKGDVHEPKTNSTRLFGKVIDVVDKMNFPKFSNDCEYLVLLHIDEILEKLGSRIDDHENFFTARMLLLLESHCLYGKPVFEDISAKIVNSYFKDYPDHKHTFQPTFLLNDICRFWKTLLLNYENKRNLPPGVEDIEERRTKQKVRNFKLKFSRMTTCFASIAALGSYSAPVTEEQVLQLTQLTPRQRLQSITSRVPKAADAVNEVIERYNWFLEMTGLPTDELEGQFSDKLKRTEMFHKATEYGDSMYQLLLTIDATGSRGLLRNLVI